MSVVSDLPDVGTCGGRSGGLGVMESWFRFAGMIELVEGGRGAVRDLCLRRRGSSLS